MADPLSNYAPESSVRPRSREQGLASLAAEHQRRREQEEYRRTHMEQLAALEHRADMDPYLRENPMRRLGYRTLGGLRAVDYLPQSPKEAFYTPTGFEGTPPKTVAVGSDYYSDPVLAHEFGHAGHDLLRELIYENPDFLRRLEDAGLQADKPPMRFEEAVVEVSDNPADTWNQPSGAPADMEHTIQVYTDRLTPRSKANVEKYDRLMQGLASEELLRRGEPPRTEPDYPTFFERLLGLR